jgi:hypothetical protein
MLHQSAIYTDSSVLRSISVTSYAGSESAAVKVVDHLPDIYVQMVKDFGDSVSLCPFELDGYKFVFINESIESINGEAAIRRLFKEGLRYRVINCAGAPQDKIAYYENAHQGYVLCNVTAVFDTTIAVGTSQDKKNVTW